MAGHAKPDGSSIFPSIGDLARVTKYSRRAIFKVVADAQRQGILVPTGIQNRRVVYRMDIEVIQGLKGAPDAPNKGASGAPSTVQDLHPTTVSRVQVVHSKGAGGALKGAGGALPLPSPSPPEQPLTPIEQETRLEFDGHAEFHGIDGVDSSVCDNRCQHLANWVKKNPELAPNLADAAGSVADQVIYDPEGGKRMKPPAPWFYEGAKGKVRDADIVRVVLKWARYSRNGTARQATSSLDNTVESMRLAEEETRRGR